MGGVAVRSILADLGLQWYFSWTRCCGGGGGNCHGAEVLCCDFFSYVESGMFLYMGQCIATALPSTVNFVSAVGNFVSHFYTMVYHRPDRI